MGAPFYRVFLRKSGIPRQRPPRFLHLHLILRLILLLGGAAVYRCDLRPVSTRL